MTKRDIIVIGSSAGGVDALCELNRHLPQDLEASVFVVMHIGTVSLLPEILSRYGNLPAAVAEHGKRYNRGCIYCAPPNYHSSIKNGVTILTRGPRENGHRPSVDVLFRSAARVHRSRVIGVVLSGGRDDGSAGLYAIKREAASPLCRTRLKRSRPTCRETPSKWSTLIFVYRFARSRMCLFNW